MGQIAVLDAAGTSRTIAMVPNTGPNVAEADSLPVTFTGPRSASGAVLIGNNKSKLRDDFGGTVLDATKWEVVSTGAGMAISLPGTTTGYLNINSGVTPSVETIIRSVEIFSLPCRLAVGISASQRIANTEFFVELIEVDAAGVPVATSPANTNSGTINDYAGMKFDGVSATSALIIARGGGAPETVSAASTIVTTVATGTSPNWFPQNLLELQVSGEHVLLNSSSVDTLNPATTARRISQCAPDPNALYKVQFRLRNLAVAPATATDYRVHFLRLFDFTRVTTEVIGGVGSSNAASGVNVNMAQGNLTQIGSAAISAATAQLGTNVAQIGGAAPAVSIANGSTNRALAVTIGSAVSQVDNNATAFAGSGRVNGATVASAQGGGAVVSAEINVTALTLGTATGGVIFTLQVSRGGTNWTDVWTSDPVTATGIIPVPGIPVFGRRRWSAHSVGGTSTTVTATITTLEHPPGDMPLIRVFRDAWAATNPFATIFNSVAQAASTFVSSGATALTATTQATTAFFIEGCKTVTAYLTLANSPTVSTQPVITVEISPDGTNWIATSATITPNGNGAYSVTLPSVAARFARLRVTTPAVYTTGNYTVTMAGIHALT